MWSSLEGPVLPMRQRCPLVILGKEPRLLGMPKNSKEARVAEAK